MKKILSTFYFLAVFSSVSFHVYSDVTPEQMAMLEMLPPDQRDNIMAKMDTANSLTEEIEDTFAEGNNLIEKPELLEYENEDEFCRECIYGFNFFKFSPSTFAPIENLPIPSNYLLGPGDVLRVNFFGNVTKEREFETTVNREGVVVLPMIGPVNLLGMTFNEASEYLTKKVAAELIGTEINLSLKKVRSIGVYVLGEAYKPGRYVVSGLSSVSNLLLVSGGVNQQGSLRNIQIKRGKEIVSTYDFYDFLLRGSLETDIILQDGDVVFIPFIESKVSMGGAFKRPNIYEFKDGETIKDSISLAGGFNSDVVGLNSRLELSRINEASATRELGYININSELDIKLQDGDVINVSSVSGLTPKTITLTGEVMNPGEFSIQPGDRILDIIERAGGYTQDAYFEGALYLREEVAKSQKEAFLRSADQLENTIVDVITQNSIGTITEFTLLPISKIITRLRQTQPPGRMVVDLELLKLKTDPVSNFLVRDRDTLHIPKRASFVSVVGEVLSSTSVGFNPDLDVFNYIDLAGGLNDSADENQIFVIYPNGESQLVQKSLFSSNRGILPGSTIVVSRDSRPYDAISITQIITPILADLATSAAAIAAISD